MKKIYTLLAVLTLVAFTANVCFASDVGIPAAIHSTINMKESPAITNTDNVVPVAHFIPAKMEHIQFLSVTISTVNKHAYFPAPPLAMKHDSNKQTKAYC